MIALPMCLQSPALRLTGYGLLASLLLCLPARAQPASGCAEAETLLDQAYQRRLIHDDAEALSRIDQAERLCPSPRVTALRGLTEQALGLWLAAEDHLAVASAVTENPWINLHRQELEAALREVENHLGLLDLALPATVTGGQLLIDGTTRVPLPHPGPIRMVAGSATIEVRIPGYAPVERRIQVPARSVAREPIQLVALVAAPEPKPAALAQGGPGTHRQPKRCTTVARRRRARRHAQSNLVLAP